MLKTMKYEVIRNKMVIIILFSILGAAEALFLFGLISDSKNMVGFGILGLVLGTSIIYFAIWLLDCFEDKGHTVQVSPMAGFCTSELGDQMIRIAYVLKAEDLLEAVECIRIALDILKSNAISLNLTHPLSFADIKIIINQTN